MTAIEKIKQVHGALSLYLLIAGGQSDKAGIRINAMIQLLDEALVELEGQKTERPISSID